MFIGKGQQQRDVITGCLLLALSGALFWASKNIKDFASIGVGADFMPLLTALLFLIVGLLMVSAPLWQQVVEPSIGLTVEVEGAERVIFGGIPAVMMSIVLMLGYLLFLDKIGFLLASAVYVFVQIQILVKGERRRHFLFVLVSVLAALISYYLFVHLFDISLPTGILG
ncbi:MULTISPECIES: tripartite tricarboxylate transporter TctB family protein [Halomonadaceae]|uniref:tripartite tricarboxylate transporter TctB family protein n=1 Tax=Halomonadaceae TaxID=28256 RepID=UPI0015999243|nr:MULTISPECIES: tripartite tricarboxylate transporter TctB family protein [Halomonas]QJQ95341.1 tripartite tricarboxylate transporter TctB family protein [Halomonas sp. PA5]